MSIEAYPLHWPAGWRRTPAYQRSHSQFRSKRSGGPYQSLTVTEGVTRLSEQFQLFTPLGRRHRVDLDAVVISSNLAVRLDGLPRSGQRAPEDPGVAVYFSLDGKDVVLACDKWHSVADNLAAIAKTLEAMRGLERWGVSDMLDRVFTGFQALPDMSTTHWRIVLQCEDTSDLEEITLRYRKLLTEAHPDRNAGDETRFFQIRQAFEQAQQELRA